MVILKKKHEYRNNKNNDNIKNTVLKYHQLDIFNILTHTNIKFPTKLPIHKNVTSFLITKSNYQSNNNETD